MEKETGEQQHPESNSDGPPQDQKFLQQQQTFFLLTMSIKGRHLSSGLVATSEPASHPSPQEVAVVPNMVEVTGALEEVSADTITAVQGVTVESPINPTLGVVVSGGRWTLSSTKTYLLRSQLPSPLTVSSDFWFPSTTFLPQPPQKAAVLVFKVPIGTARSTNRKNSL